MKLTGRIFHLVDNPQMLRDQLNGVDVDGTDAPYTYGVNTDAMISGAACLLGYTNEILGPHFLEMFQDVVGDSEVARGGFQVIVAGHAYGSGSSREAAVVAHKGAGIELVIADSFQRIFQENMVYVGMPFTADRNVLSRLHNGEDIPEHEFFDALPPFFKAVAYEGGLLRYGTRLLAGEIAPILPQHTTPGPMNIVEKIIAARTYLGPDEPDGVPYVTVGDQVLARTAFRGMHEYTAGMVMSLYRAEWGDAPMYRPDLVAAFEDHFPLIGHDAVPAHVRALRLAPAKKLAQEMVDVCEANHIRLHGPNRPYPAGVCHRLVVEQYALPGDIVVLTDSHTPTAGVLNALAFGVGSAAIAFSLRTGLIPVTVPKVVRVEFFGQAKGGLSPKDVILHLIGDPYFREEQWREGPTDTCVIEFCGPALDQWTVDELSVLTNMTVEGGLMTGIVEPCRPIVEFLVQNRGITHQQAERLLVYPDAGAHYTKHIRIDLERVPLTIATPGDSRNRAPLSEFEHVQVHNVVIASCTGASVSDLIAADEVLTGRRFAPHVRVTVTPSSEDVAEEAERRGILERFRRLGAVVTDPGCGSCIGNGPGIPLDGEVTASTTNRNFARRMGAPGPVYLVSPAVAAASAVTGYLTDPRVLSGKP